VSKHSNEKPVKREYHDIHMPSNSPLGFYIGVFSFLFGFGMVWYMFWLVLVSTVGIIACSIMHLYQKHKEYNLKASVIAKIEQQRGNA
jgi:cytochrome o ubiquinol oxidase subunit 1